MVVLTPPLPAGLEILLTHPVSVLMKYGFLGGFPLPLPLSGRLIRSFGTGLVAQCHCHGLYLF